MPAILAVVACPPVTRDIAAGSPAITGRITAAPMPGLGAVDPPFHRRGKEGAERPAELSTAIARSLGRRIVAPARITVTASAPVARTQRPSGRVAPQSISGAMATRIVGVLIQPSAATG